MNKVFVSLNTVFLIILFLTLIFSVYSIPKLEISDEETIKINFYELDQIKRSSKNSSSFPSSKTENIDKVNVNKKIDDSGTELKNQKFSIDKKDIKKEISKIKLSKEKESIVRVSASIQDKISSIWIKPNSLSQILTAKVLINLAPSGEVFKFELIELSSNKAFNDSILITMEKINFFEEVSLKEISKDLGDDDLIAKVSQLEIDIMALEFTELRLLSALEGGGNPGAESSILKIKGTEIQQRLTELYVEAAGEFAIPYGGPDGYGSNIKPNGPDYTNDALSKYLNMRKVTIYGGSNEIQKNIISKYVLGV